MVFRTLGRTGLQVSVAGLGGGGHSRLGLAKGGSMEDAARLVRTAFDLGVNYLDTAESYGTEPAVALGLRGVSRDQYVLSTKASVEHEGRMATGPEFSARIDGCLARLGVDMIDVFSLHGISQAEYDHARQELMPALIRAQEQGKIRFLGLTEQFIRDTSHQVFQKTLADDAWDVLMVGFNFLNQSARTAVFPTTIERGLGVQLMFAVRRALSQPDALRELIQDLIAEGHDFGPDFDPDHPLDFLLESGAATSIPEAAYRYCVHEPGVDVVLFGTSSADHLKENLDALQKGPLLAAAKARLDRMFAGVDWVSGN